jgi:hypothetical protein
MGYHANAAPPGITSHHNELMLKLECAAFRRSKKRLRVSRLRGNHDSINLFGGSKIKFIIHFMPTKTFGFSDTENRPIGKTDDDKTSATRQAWKHDI